MATVRFLRDFRGVSTNEQFYEAGEVVDLANAALVVAEGAAEYFSPPEVIAETLPAPDATPEPEAPPIKTPIKKTRGKKS